jgi:subtilisin family serine protease
VIRLLALLTALLAAGCALAPEPAAPPAPAMLDARHIVVTVDADAPPGLGAELAARHGLALVAQWPLAALGVRCLVLAAPPGGGAAAMAALGAEPAVRLVQPMQGFTTGSAAAGEAPPAGPALPQPNLARTGAAAAHAAVRGEGVLVALVDTGVDLGHPDLAGGRHTERDFVADAARPPPERHGTAMAGLVAANGRLTGIAPAASLLALRGCWEEADGGRCSSVSLARALNFAILRGAGVISLSLAGPRDPLLEALLGRAAARGAVIVAAAPRQPPAFPASHPKAVAGGAGGIAAPDVDVPSLLPGSGYGFFSGASVATAQLAGAAALLRAAAPELGAERLGAALREAAAARGELDICGTLGRAGRHLCDMPGSR